MSKFLIENVPPNPSIEFANNVVVPKGTTEIVSRGGGSTIDVAKWVARRNGLKHIAVPTTAGTGSEVTPFVVLTVDGRKKTFTDQRFVPDAYILDPFLVVSLPEEHTVASGLDALSQSLESIWSTKATTESIQYATVGMELAIKSLRRTIEKPDDVNARMDMLIAANMSGRAIAITQTNVCHAISYPLTDWYGIPHGIACAMSLGYFADKVGFPLGDILKKVLEPYKKKYKIDRKKVAKEAIKSLKLEQFPLPVTELDIYKSLI